MSSVPIDSLSANSVDRDELIDQMQSKIGELLSVNQELCQVKNQNDFLNNEKQTLQNEVKMINELNQDNQSKISQMSQTNQKIVKENQSLKKAIEEMQQQFKIYKNNLKETYDKKIQSITNEFNKQVQEKDEKYEESSKLMNELKDREKEHLQIIGEKNSEIDQMKAQFSSTLKKLEKTKNDIKVFNDKYKEIQQQYETTKATVDQLTQKSDACIQEITTLKTVIKDKDTEIEKQSAQINELTDKISEFQSINSQFKTADELKKVLTGQKKAYSQLNMKYQNCKRNLSLIMQKYNQQEKAIQDATHDLSDVQENASTLQDQLKKYERENEQCNRKIEKYQFREQIAKSIMKGNSFLLDRISLIESKINPEYVKTSLRSLVITVISLRRWRSLVGCPKGYERDIKIWWWWLVPTESSNSFDCSSNHNIKSIVTLIEAQTKANENQIAEIEKLKTSISEFEVKEKQANEEITKQNELLENQSNKIDVYNNEIKDIMAKLQTMVDFDQYDTLNSKYISVKSALKASKELIRQQDETILSLRDKIQILEQHKREQHNRLKMSAINNEHFTRKLSNAHEKIGELEIELDYREKQNLALERHLNKGEITESRLRTNCISMAHKNGYDIFSTPDYQKCESGDLKSKLREMSQNLMVNVY